MIEMNISHDSIVGYKEYRLSKDNKPILKNQLLTKIMIIYLIITTLILNMIYLKVLGMIKKDWI